MTLINFSPEANADEDEGSASSSRIGESRGKEHNVQSGLKEDTIRIPAEYMKKGSIP